MKLFRPGFTTETIKDDESMVRPSLLAAVLLSLCLGTFVVQSLCAQIETVRPAPQPSIWVSHGRVEGRLALRYSPEGAFSPASSTLAVVSEDKVVLMNLRDASVQKVLRPRVGDITDLEMQSANFVSPDRLFVLATGMIRVKRESGGAATPLLGFLWETASDALFGKVNAIGARGGFGAARYFPQLGYLAMYKDSNFILWNPVTGQGPQINLPILTRQPNLYAFSPDGHWLLLAQIEASGTADPVVVKLSEHQFVDSLRGHRGTVLGISFSRDTKKVVTACEDGNVRIWSAPDWKLLQTLSGHQGPVHWAEFSSDGNWVASGGEDKTVRIWSGEDGKLVQTLQESQAPVLTVAFSPNDEFLAASAEQTVFVWQRTRVQSSVARDE